MTMVKAEQEVIYFAGGLYWKKEELVFGAVRPTNGLPYLTTNPNGLLSTAHHSSLYCLSADRTKATRVAPRNSGLYGNPLEVELSLELQKELQAAIVSAKRYNN